MVAMASAAAAGAEDLGRIGPTHDIAEPDLLVHILARIDQAGKSGRLAQLQREAVERAKANIETPAPVAGVTRTRVPRSFHYDPAIEISQPVTDAQGRVLIAPGTRLNPLSLVSLSKRLFFFDGRDAAQVKQAEQRLAQGEILKPILVAGAPLQLIRRWKRPVYFDQGGTLVQRLGIRHVPALAYQDGLRIRIDELR